EDLRARSLRLPSRASPPTEPAEKLRLRLISMARFGSWEHLRGKKKSAPIRAAPNARKLFGGFAFAFCRRFGLRHFGFRRGCFRPLSQTALLQFFHHHPGAGVALGGKLAGFRDQGFELSLDLLRFLDRHVLVG